MLLDLDAGTITAYKTMGRGTALKKMGVMANEVKGPVRWAAVHGNSWNGSSIEIFMDKPDGYEINAHTQRRKAAAINGRTFLPGPGD